MMHNCYVLRSFTTLSGDHLLDLGLGESLELRASTDKVTVKVDVGNGSLSVKFLEVGLDGGWEISLVSIDRIGRLTSVLNFVESNGQLSPLEVVLWIESM